MERKKMNEILSQLLISGNIVTVSFDEMVEVRKQLSYFAPKVKIEIIDSDFENISFRELAY